MSHPAHEPPGYTLATVSTASPITREHLFFIPLIFFLGAALGALTLRWQLARSESRHPALRSPLPRPRVSARGLLLPLAAFAVLFVATHLSSLHSGPRALSEALQGQPLFDQRPSFSADEVYARLTAFGPEGRAAYRRLTFGGDLLFPLGLFAFLLQLTRFVSERLPALTPRLRALLLLPPLAWLLADLGENALLFRLLTRFPERHDALAGYLGTVTDLEFTLLLASIALPALLSVRLPRASPPP